MLELHSRTEKVVSDRQELNLWDHQGAVQKAQASFKVGEASFELKQNLSADI